MSPRAAARLESMGFAEVHDYVAGKAGWGSFGLPLEGENPTASRAGPHVRTDVPTCGPQEHLHAVCDRLDESGWSTCFVVDERGVLLGRIGRKAIRDRADAPAEDAMTLGPSTIRPSARLTEVVERMEKQNLTGLPVTRPDGTLVGLLSLEAARAALAGHGA